MNFPKIVSLSCIPFLFACGGGADTGTSGGGSSGGGGTVPPQLVNPLGLTASDTAGMWDFRRTVDAEFDSLNTSAPISAAPGPRAIYEGQMLARKGTGQEFMGGDFVIDIDFTSGTGTGFIDNMDISGTDTTNRFLESANPNQLNVAIDTISGATISGTVSGTVSELSTSSVVVPGTFNPDSYSVSATLDGRIVDDQSTGGVLTGLAATIDGTVTSAVAGTETLQGVMAGPLSVNSP